MGTTYYTQVFYVAKSKERHPLIVNLFRSASQFGKLKKVKRGGGYLTVHITVSDNSRDQSNELLTDQYENLCSLGYISDSIEGPYWRCSSGMTSDIDDSGDWGRIDVEKQKRKELLTRLWGDFPNLMQKLKESPPIP